MGNSPPFGLLFLFAPCYRLKIVGHLNSNMKGYAWDAKEDILAVARAFMRSRIILTAAELDLFTIIQDASTSAEKIAERFGFDRRALERVLDCLVTFGLLEQKRRGLFANR